jgi:hypothetical protein
MFVTNERRPTAAPPFIKRAIRAAEHYEISASAAVKWMKRFRETGSCAAKACGSSTSPLEEYADFLLTLITEQPDLTLDEIVTIMRKYKIPGKRTSVWRFFQRHRPRNDAPGLMVASIICSVARRRSTRP